METTVTTHGAQATIRLAGRFDFNAHREFRSAVDSVLAMAEVNEIRVDLNNVDYLDSSALGMLLMVRDKAKSAGGRTVVIANAKAGVRHVLDIANFGKLFTMI